MASASAAVGGNAIAGPMLRMVRATPVSGAVETISASKLLPSATATAGRKANASAPPPAPASHVAPLPPAESGTFRVVTWNILGQVYAKSQWFTHSPRPCLKQARRWAQIHELVRVMNPDVMLLQEVDNFGDVHEPAFRDLGFDALYLQRPNGKHDGCCVAYRREKFEIVDDDNAVLKVDLNEIALSKQSKDDVERFTRDNVALAVRLRVRAMPTKEAVFATTHLFWDPAMADVKLAQARSVADTVLKVHSNAPLIVFGADLNSTLDSDVVAEFHQRSFVDSYAAVRDSSTCENKFVTNVTPDFTEAIDHLYLRGHGARVEHVLELPHATHPDVSGGLPNWLWPSDHLPLAADVRI